MWIHLLTLGLIDGAGGATPPEPPTELGRAGGWIEYRKHPKKKKVEELLATGAPATVQIAERKLLGEPVLRTDPKLVEAVSGVVEVVKAAATQYNATIQRQRREEEELLLMF